MFNRHGLVAGATGTGKTKTLQAHRRAALRAGCRCCWPTSRATCPGCRGRARHPDGSGPGPRTPATTGPRRATPSSSSRSAGRARRRRSARRSTQFGPILLSKVLDLNDTRSRRSG
jgi:hypothetical protein